MKHYTKLKMKTKVNTQLLINILHFCYNLAEYVFIFVIIDNHLWKTNEIYGNKPLSNPLSN